MKNLLFLILLFLTIRAFAQEPAHFLVGKDAFDGLQLYSIIQDNDQSMWISSDRGIFNYDGITIRQLETPNLNSKSLFGLTKDKLGNIYCYNLNGEIFIIKNNQLKVYYTLPKEYTVGTMQIGFDIDNNLLISSKKKLIILSPSKKIREIKEKTALYFTQNGDEFYYGEQKIRKGPVTLIKYSSFDTREHLGDFHLDKFLRSIYAHKNSVYSYSHILKALFDLSGAKPRKIDLSFFGNDHLIIFPTADDLWFSDYQNGVYKVAKDEIENTEKNYQKWFGDFYISNVYVDNEKNIWLLTFKKGIIVIPSSSIKSNFYKIKNEKINGISKSKNSIYVGAASGTIFHFDNPSFSPFLQTDNHRLEEFNIYPEYNIVTTNNGVYKNEKEISRYSFSRADFIRNDTVFKATSYGLEAININNGLSKRLTKTRLYDMLYDEKTEQIWLPSSVGLELYKNGKRTSYLHNGKTIIAKKLLKAENQIWASFNEGVWVFENDKIVDTLSVANGKLISNHIFNLKYEKPYVYFASPKGIQQYNTQTKTSKNLTKSNGLTKVIAEFEVLNDTLYGIISDGIVTFSFNNWKDNIPQYQTKVKNAIVNGQQKITENATLKPEENNIEFSFLTPTFKFQKNLRYEYQLVGLEKQKIKAREGQYFVNYSNLSAGNYTFIVDSYIGNQKNKTATFHFKIQRYWYNMWWFKVFIILTFIAVLYYIYRARLNVINRKRNKEAMQKRLAESSLTSLKAQMNPHFLFNAMNSISLLIVENQNKEAFKYLSRLSNLVRENLLMSDVVFVSFADELKLIEKYLELEKLRFEDTFTFTIQNNITNQQVQIPSMIIQPFIENAMKHGLLHKKNDRNLDVIFTEKEELVECIVIDNGIGRKASEEIQKRRKYKSFSTNAIKKRFDILKEYYKMDIGFEYEDLYQNNQPTGTKVIIKIPINVHFSK